MRWMRRVAVPVALPRELRPPLRPGISERAGRSLGVFDSRLLGAGAGAGGGVIISR